MRKLADIAWPVMGVELVECRGRKAFARAVSAHERKEMLAQRCDIGEALAQRRNVDGKDREAVVEIEAKVARGGSCFEILVRRRDHPHVHLYGVIVSDALDLTV